MINKSPTFFKISVIIQSNTTCVTSLNNELPSCKRPRLFCHGGLKKKSCVAL